MRALCLAAAESLQWIDVPEPPPPAPGEAQVAVRAIGICGTDIAGYLGTMPFIQFPRILGHELGVEVLRIGSGPTPLRPGDRCSVEPYLNCATCDPCRSGRPNCCESLRVLGVHSDGGMTARLNLPTHKLHRSRHLSFEQLALVETLGIGCHAVDRSQLDHEDDALIIGAGPIGLSVLEFARMRAGRVRVLDLNPARRAFVKSHYADVEVLDPTLPPPRSHVVFDATGSSASMATSLQWARFAGRVVFVGITSTPVQLDDSLFHRRELTLLASRNALPNDFPKIISAIEAGIIHTDPWITHRARLDELSVRLPEWIQPDSGTVKAMVAPLAPSR